MPKIVNKILDIKLKSRSDRF